MNRRRFLEAALSAPAMAALSHLPIFASRAAAEPQKEFAPRPGTWRTFEIKTRVEVLEPAGVTRVWLPVPVVASDYQRPGESNWSGSAGVMRTVIDPKFGAAML